MFLRLLAELPIEGENASDALALCGSVQTTAQDAAPGSYGSAIIQMLLTLTAIIVLLFLSFWFIRRLIHNRLHRGGGEQAIHILEKRMISPKTILYWIEVDNKKILISESQLEVRRLESFAHLEEKPE